MTPMTVNPLPWSFVLTGVTLFSLPPHAQSWPDVAASDQHHIRIFETGAGTFDVTVTRCP